jgi:hypothetical protein
VAHIQNGLGYQVCRPAPRPTNGFLAAVLPNLGELDFAGRHHPLDGFLICTHPWKAALCAGEV